MIGGLTQSLGGLFGGGAISGAGNILSSLGSGAGSFFGGSGGGSGAGGAIGGASRAIGGGSGAGGLLGSLFGGGSGAGGLLGSLGNIGMQLIPGLMGQTARRSPVDRSILNLQNVRREIDSMRQSAMMMRDARQSISTAAALLSSSGFMPGIGSMAEIVPQESLLSLGRGLEAIRGRAAIQQAESEMEGQLMGMQQAQQPSPFSSQLFSTVVQPLASRGIQSLGKWLGSKGTQSPGKSSGSKGTQSPGRSSGSFGK